MRFFRSVSCEDKNSPIKQSFYFYSSLLRTEVKQKKSDGNRTIFFDDFSSGNLDKWLVTGPRAEIVKLDGYNTLCVSEGYGGGVNAQFNSEIDAVSFIQIAFSFMLEKEGSVATVRYSDPIGVEISNILSNANGGKYSPGVWYSAKIHIALPVTIGSDGISNFIFTPGDLTTDTESNGKVYFRDISLTQLQHEREVTFEDDSWESIYEKNSSLSYVRKDGMLNLSLDSVPPYNSNDRNPLFILKRDDVIPGENFIDPENGTYKQERCITAVNCKVIIPDNEWDVFLYNSLSGPSGYFFIANAMIQHNVFVDSFYPDSYISTGKEKEVVSFLFGVNSRAGHEKPFDLQIKSVSYLRATDEISIIE